MRHTIRVGTAMIPVALAGACGARRLLINERAGGDGSFAVTLQALGGAKVRVTVGGDTTDLCIAGDEANLFIHCDGEVYELAVLDPLSVYGQAAGRLAGLEARAPMPGNVVAVPVTVGDAVRAGDTLIVVESMKLEVTLRAECDAMVSQINCVVGQSFEKGALLVGLSARDTAA
jgi:3-methylcrotonyl-CoA carboxylase alpha subunit